jgi:hypothetical protein
MMRVIGANKNSFVKMMRIIGANKIFFAPMTAHFFAHLPGGARLKSGGIVIFAFIIELTSDNMDISGKIIAILPEQGGVSKSGNEWKKQEYVLETYDQFPKKICFQFFGSDRITQANIRMGEDITVYFDIESREYQGRWFTNINAWKVERKGGSDFSANPAQSVPANFMPPSAPLAPAAPDFPPPSEKDDLPF